MSITEPGVYSMPAEEYHTDPCPYPSLNASVAKEIIAHSPAHGFAVHPKLNGNYLAKEAEKFDRGEAWHALLFEGEDRMVKINADDYRTNAAKAARDAARAAGKYPILADKVDAVWAMRDESLKAIRKSRYLAGLTLKDGMAEQVLAWHEDEGIWCRARLDWLSHDRRIILDGKSIDGSAHPNDYERTMLGQGGEIQGAHYIRGNAATGGPEDAVYIMVVQECNPPFACCLIGLSPAYVEFGMEKVKVARAAFAHGLSTGEWPGYPDDVCWLEPAAWASAKWEERGTSGGIPYDVAKMMEAMATGRLSK